MPPHCFFYTSGVSVDNFLLGIEYDPNMGNYVAQFADGEEISLAAASYSDAMIEAHSINLCDYE